MRVSGEAAAAYQAIRTDSFSTINRGPLVEADDETGQVAWKDKTGELVTAILGAHQIRIIPKHR